MPDTQNNFLSTFSLYKQYNMLRDHLFFDVAESYLSRAKAFTLYKPRCKSIIVALCEDNR